MEKTFVILKSDAIDFGHVGAIIQRFENAGFVIERMELRYKNIAWAHAHYSHLPEHVMKSVATFMQGPLIGIVLSGYDAIAKIRKMTGNTQPNFAEPGTIRFDFGKYRAPRNVLHSSDCEKNVDIERALFFDRFTDANKSIH